ncbi:hypothetical protein [Streptomyces sp. YIM S03343]
MHRTTTTAALLVTVAAAALSGCMTVQRPAVPGPSAAPSPLSAPGPDGSTRPRAVQAPAREALEVTGPSRRASPGEGHPDGATAAPAPVHRHTLPDSRPHPAPRPPVDVPTVPDASGISRTVRRNTDVCALGRKYGGWRPDSPESTVCERAYKP